MSEDNGFVERPVPGSPGHALAKVDYAAILATAENGKAVRIPLNGRSRSGIDNALRLYLMPRGYRQHTHDTKDGYLTVWAEKR